MFSLIACAAYAVVSLSVVLAALYRFSVSTYDKWERAGVPYVKPVAPLFGNFFGVVSGADHQVDFFRRAYSRLAGHKYGGLFLMRTPYLMVRDPEMVHNVLVRDFAHFQNRGIYSDVSVNPLMDNMFVMNNPRWKTIRSKLSPAFTSGRLRAMHGQIKECSDELMRNMRRELAAGAGHEVEVRDLLGKFSTDVIGTCVFGLRLNAIKDDDSEFRKYGKLILLPSVRFVLRELCLMISPAIIHVLKIRDFSVRATEFFMRAFAETIAYRERNHIVRNDIVNHLIEARKDLVLNDSLPEEQKFTESQIVANAFVLFLAGFETTSTTISFCLYELALKKHIQDRVREEITSKIAKHEGQINNDFLADLDYLEMVIAETLRKHPVLFASFREATETYQVPNDSLIIEKGQKIIIPTHSLHYDPRYFPDPGTFDPERFTPEEKAKRPKCCYIPFGEGPRVCIGKRFAEMEMKMALSEILSKFEVEPCEKTDIPMKYGKKALLVIPENGIWLRFKPISN